MGAIVHMAVSFQGSRDTLGASGVNWKLTMSRGGGEFSSLHHAPQFSLVEGTSVPQAEGAVWGGQYLPGAGTWKQGKS